MRNKLSGLVLAIISLVLIAATGDSSSWEKWKLQASDLEGYYDWCEKQREAYCSKVEIENSKVEVDEKGPLKLSADVKNAGNQVIEEARLTVFFLDVNGEPVFEKKVRPLQKGPFLRPGYSIKFNLSLEDVPSVWSGDFKITIDELEFGPSCPFSHDYEKSATRVLDSSDQLLLIGCFDDAAKGYESIIEDDPKTLLGPRQRPGSLNDYQEGGTRRLSVLQYSVSGNVLQI